MKYIFEVEAFVVGRASRKQKRIFHITYRKPLGTWTRADYYIIENYLAKRKDVQGDASIISIKELSI